MARQVWRAFCLHGTIFIEFYELRGTSFIGSSFYHRLQVLKMALARDHGAGFITGPVK